MLAHWILSALCLLLVAHFVPGFFVRGFATALIAAVVIGLVNATIGMLLKIITFPLTILTFGVFWLLINALMLKFAALFVPGFEVRGLWPAFWGGLILSLLNMIVRQLLKKSEYVTSTCNARKNAGETPAPPRNGLKFRD
jgi:putative membrane protein